MALPTNYVKSHVIFSTPNRDYMINVLWHKFPDVMEANQTTADNFATTLSAAVQQEVKNILTTSSEFVGVSVQLSTNGVVYNSVQLIDTGPGVNDADELPAYCAVVIQKRTNTGGKSGRGRWYVPGIPDTLSDEGQLTPLGRSKYVALATKYSAPVNVGADTGVPMHYSALGKLLIPIISVGVPFELGTQRRRRLRPDF